MTPTTDLNLSRRPFVNRRPVRRLAVLLWALALPLTALSGWLYFKHFTGKRLTGEQQVEIRERMAEEQRLIAALSAEMQTFDVAADNTEAEYLNQRILERTFPWSALFDHLTEAMPGRVRLMTLSPTFAERSSRRRNRGMSAEDVLLSIRGAAKSDEDLLVFVDNLFAHDRFRSPNLMSERRDESGEYDFSLNVVYRAALPAAETPEPDGGPDAEPGAEAEAVAAASPEQAAPGAGREEAAPSPPTPAAAEAQ